MASDQGRPVLLFAESGDGKSAPLPEVVPDYTAYPEVVKPATDAEKYPEVVPSAPAVPEKDIIPAKQEEILPVKEEPPAQDRTPKTLFGFRRRWVIIAGVAIVLIIIAAVVGGVVGSQKKSSDASPAASTPGSDEANADTKSAASASTGTATGTATTSSTATGTSVVQTAIAAAVAFDDDDEASYQVFYQPASSDKVNYRVHADKFGDEKGISIPRTRDKATPMALTSFGSSGNSALNLFYVDNSGDETKIVMSSLTCKQGGTSCSEGASEVVAENPLARIHPDSKIAAIWLGNGTNSIRAYFQSINGSLVELNVGNKFKTRILPAQAVNGSNIAITMAKGPVISILYVSEDYKRPEVLNYVGKDGWVEPTPVNSEAIPGWTPGTGLAACYEPTVDVYRFYYTDSATNKIMEWWRYGTDKFFRVPGTSSIWLPADSGLAALCWQDQARLLYFSDGKLKESVLNNGTWVGTRDVGSS